MIYITILAGLLQLYNTITKSSDVSPALVTALGSLIVQVQQTAKRSGEMTEEQEQVFDALLDEAALSEDWTPLPKA